MPFCTLVNSSHIMRMLVSPVVNKAYISHNVGNLRAAVIEHQPQVMRKHNNAGQMFQSSRLDRPGHWEYLAKKTQPCLNLLSQLSIFSQQDYKHDHHSVHVSAENIKSMFGECLSLLWIHGGKAHTKLFLRCKERCPSRTNALSEILNGSLISAANYSFIN